MRIGFFRFGSTRSQVRILSPRLTFKGLAAEPAVKLRSKAAPATTDGVPISTAMVSSGSVRIETSGYLCAPTTQPATSRTLLKWLKDL